jgi:hypothetical protein
MVELKALNGCIIQASEDAVPKLLAAGFVHVNQTAHLETPKAATTRKRTTKTKE